MRSAGTRERHTARPGSLLSPLEPRFPVLSSTKKPPRLVTGGSRQTSSELRNKNPRGVFPRALQSPQIYSFVSQGAPDPQEASFDGTDGTG